METKNKPGKITCRWCGMSFETLVDHREHEACHTTPLPEVKTEVNSHSSDGGPAEIAWEHNAELTA